MDEHLAAWQIHLGRLGRAEGSLSFDECGECVSWLAGVIRVAAYE